MLGWPSVHFVVYTTYFIQSTMIPSTTSSPPHQKITQSISSLYLGIPTSPYKNSNIFAVLTSLLYILRQNKNPYHSLSVKWERWLSDSTASGKHTPRVLESLVESQANGLNKQIPPQSIYKPEYPLPKKTLIGNQYRFTSLKFTAQPLFPQDIPEAFAVATTHAPKRRILTNLTHVPGS